MLPPQPKPNRTRLPEEAHHDPFTPARVLAAHPYRRSLIRRILVADSAVDDHCLIGRARIDRTAADSDGSADASAVRNARRLGQNNGHQALTAGT